MCHQPRVFVTRQIPGNDLDRLRAVANVDVWPDRLPPSRDEMLRRVAGCDALLTLLSDKIDAELMDAAGPQLRVVSNYAVGINNIDLVTAKQRNIRIGNTPDVLTDATADLAVSLALAASRHVGAAAVQVTAGGWKTWEPTGWLGVELAGKTLGIVGMGRIGAAVARRLVGGWGMDLLYTARTAKPDVKGQHVTMDELLKRSDFISLHVPLTDATTNLIDAPEFAKMKPTAVLVNTARGEIVNQDALVTALRTKQIFAAGLDVTTPEPLSPEHPLVGCDNAIILPHIGSATFAARHAMSRIAVDHILDGLSLRTL